MYVYTLTIIPRRRRSAPLACVACPPLPSRLVELLLRRVAAFFDCALMLISISCP